MKKNKGINNTKLGLFALAGVLFLIFMLYMIGRNRNLFGSTLTIQTVSLHVDGLVPGNNVRFKGLNIGTVKSIDIKDDTAIYISMVIDDKMQPFIKKNALTSIGTDGLMGSKLVNINPQAANAPAVEEGDILYSREPIQTDAMLRTLDATNHNVAKISENLLEITTKLNNSASLAVFLSDTGFTQDLKVAMAEFRKAGANTAQMTRAAREIATDLAAGDGIAYKLFTDTVYVEQLSSALQEIQEASNTAAQTVAELQIAVGQLNNTEGTAGLILTDTLLRNTLLRTMQNVEQGTDRFNENMEALKSNFLFRRYFKKQEKQRRKDAASISKAQLNQE